MFEKKEITVIENLCWMVGMALVCCFVFTFRTVHNNKMRVQRAIECNQAYHDVKTGEIIYKDKDIEYIVSGIRSNGN